MPLNFGDLSFRKGGTQVVGLPLDVIDKVGTNLTEKYYRNRQAVGRMKQDVLNLPDANAEGNKKIIKELSDQVASEFEAYGKEDNWFDADKKVFDMSDKLMSDTRIKELHQFAGMAAQVDKSIDESKAPENWQQLRRAKNRMMNNDGIRDKDGNSRTYNGSTLPGNMDISESVKYYADLAKGWKADIQTMTDNGGKININETSDGFKQYATRFGTTKITSVNPQEVKDFLMGIVMIDAKLKSNMDAIAELTLFGRTQKMQADETDVKELAINKAATSPYWASTLIASSEKFNKETVNMKAAAKSAYISKIMADANLKQTYLNDGGDGYVANLKLGLSKYPDTFDRAYKDSYMSDFETTINGIANKEGYRNVETDYKYLGNNLDSKMYEQYQKATTFHPLFTNKGQVTKDGLLSHYDILPKLNRDISVLEASIKAMPKDQQEIATSRLNKLKSDRNTTELLINSYKTQLGIKDEDVIRANEKDLVTGSFYDYAKNDLIELGMDFLGMKHDKASIKLSKPIRQSLFDVTLKNRNSSVKDIQNILKSKNVIVSDSNIIDMMDSMNGIVKSEVKKQLELKGTENMSSPIQVVGNIAGVDDIEFKAATDNVKERLLKGDGSMYVIEAGEKFKAFRGTTNNGMTLNSVIKEKGVAASKDYEINVSPAYFNIDSGQLGKSMYSVDIKDEEGTWHNVLVRDDAAPGLMDAVNSNAIKKLAKNIANPNNNFASTDITSMRTIFGATGGSIPVTKIGGKDFTNLSLANALDRLSKNDKGNYDPIEVNDNGINIIVQPFEVDGKLNIRLKSPAAVNDFNKEGQILDDIIEVNSLNAAAMYISALKERSHFRNDPAAYNAITQAMQLHNKFDNNGTTSK